MKLLRALLVRPPHCNNVLQAHNADGLRATDTTTDLSSVTFDSTFEYFGDSAPANKTINKATEDPSDVFVSLPSYVTIVEVRGGSRVGPAFLGGSTTQHSHACSVSQLFWRTE